MRILKTTKILIILLFIFSQFSIEVFSEQQTATVNVEVLNVREGPGIHYPLIDKIQKNEEFPVLKNEGDWVQLQLTEQKKGWVANWLITTKATTLPQKETNQEVKEQIITPNVPSLRVRKGPGTDYQAIGYISTGDKLKKIGEENNWVKIEYDSGTGWVAANYVDTVDVISKPKTNESNEIMITASILNVREQPSLASKVVGKVVEGETFTYTAQKDDWYKISLNNVIGWIHGDYVKHGKPVSQKPKSEKDEFIVAASVLNVRDEPTLDGNVVGQLKDGEVVTVIESSGKWSKINLKNKVAWVYNVYLKKPDQDEIPMVTVLYNVTNIREKPTTQSSILRKANQGEQFLIINKEGDWYHIQLGDGTKAYIAGWIVDVTGPIEKVKNDQSSKVFKGKTILLDPGHGGRDNGTTGTTGFHEKVLTLKTAQSLAEMLESAGANVVITRTGDKYLPLTTRVSLSHHYHADAYISIHYNSSTISSVKGISTFYYSSQKDKKLAESIHKELLKTTGLSDRKAKFGDYHVIRENKQPSVLLELGFLSNKQEEAVVRSNDYQQKAVKAIYKGLENYFK